MNNRDGQRYPLHSGDVAAERRKAKEGEIPLGATQMRSDTQGIKITDALCAYFPK